MSKTITELSVASPAISLSDELPIYRPSLGTPKTRKATVGDIIALVGSSSDLSIIDNYGDGIHTTGTGATVLLTSIGYDDTTAAAQWPRAAAYWGSVNASNTSYDAVVWAEAMLSMEYLGIHHMQVLDNKVYYIVTPTSLYIPLPKYDRTKSSSTEGGQFKIEGNSCIMRNASGAARVLLDRYPADQTEALNDMVSTAVHLSNITFYGANLTAGSGDTGIRLSATKGSLLSGLRYRNLDIGQLQYFNLYTTSIACQAQNCKTAGFKTEIPSWTGASATGSGSQPYFLGCQAMIPADAYGFYIGGADSGAIRDSVVEHNASAIGAYGIYYNNNGSTVSKNFTIENIHIEQQYTGAAIGVRGNGEVFVTIRNCYSQIADTFAELTNVSGVNRIFMDAIGNHSSSNWLLRNIHTAGTGGCWVFNMCKLQGDPTTAANIVDTVGYPNIWTGDSDVPSVSRVRITEVH